MSRWFSRWRRKDEATASHGQRRQRAADRRGSRRTGTDHRRPLSPLTWTDPDQDFITRYGDPFDG